MIVELLTKKYPGMRLWLTQRLTALVMAAYTVFIIVLLLVQQPSGYAGWHSFASRWWLRVLTWLFFICLTMHAWLGVRDVMRDYVFNTTLRGYMQIVVDVLLVIYLVWLSFILFNI